VARTFYVFQPVKVAGLSKLSNYLLYYFSSKTLYIGAIFAIFAYMLQRYNPD